MGTQQNMYYVHTAHLGSYNFVMDASKNIIQSCHFDPCGNRKLYNNWSVDNTATVFLFSRGYTSHEHLDMFKIINMNARLYDPVIGRFFSPDPVIQDYEATQSLNRYSYCQNNPVNRVDLDGELDNPVYDSDGNYRGNTIEGFTGEVIIYDGNIDFRMKSKDQLLSNRGADTYDNQRNNLSGYAKSKIWTNIASHFEGLQVYDEKFTMNDLQDKKIHFGGFGGWTSSWVLGAGKGKISGSDGHNYETTVENIASSIIVHEWYSHINTENRNNMKSHRLAYKNVINYKHFWNNTTDSYKRFNVNRLKDYTREESGGKKTQVDKLYRNLYEKYTKYSW